MKSCQDNCVCVCTRVEGDIAYISGVFIFKDYPHGESSMISFLKEYHQTGVLPFDDCIGCYQVRIDRKDGTKLYFTDHYGGTSFFIHWKSGSIASRLSDILPAGHRTPNYDAIAQFLYFNCIYSDETIVAGVSRSNPDSYYIAANGVVEQHSKNLTPLYALESRDNALELLMKRVLYATDTLKKGCSITGGTDSRSILAHLLAQGEHPILSITGGEDDVDVKIAKEIAACVKEQLVVSSDRAESETWLQESQQYADGSLGICGFYRLIKQDKTLSDIGVTLKFDGVAGELYKNSFLNQDFPFYGGAPNWKKFVKFKLVTFDFPNGLCAGETAQALEQMKELMYRRFSQYIGETKAQAYLLAGYDIMRYRLAPISNMENQFHVAYSPLMERSVAASVLRTPPFSLEMQAWQRRQVTQYFPLLKDIRTDRGLTCNTKRMGAERMKSTLFLVNVALRRIFSRKQVSGRIDACLEDGLSSETYRNAVKRCVQLGILSPNVEAEKIPLSIADRILTIGTFL